MPKGAEQIREFVQSGPNPSQADKATQLFSKLFGGEWWKILWSGEGIHGEPSLIFPILNVFNSVVLIAVAILLLYIVGHAFVGSAHEGVPLGSRMHSIWVPIRAVLGMSLLSPIPWAKSLCIIQGIVLAFVGFSIQMGNMAATAGLQYISKHHGEVVATVPDNLKETGSKIAEAALHNYLIQYHQTYFQDKPLIKGYKTINAKKQKKTKDLVGVKNTPLEGEDPNTIVYKFKAPEPYDSRTMGSIVLNCKDLGSRVCKARQVSLERLLSEMDNIALQRVRQLAGIEGASMPGKQAVTSSIDDYGRNMKSAITHLVDKQNNALRQELDLFTKRVDKQGFIMLGSYYWTLSRFNMAVLDQIESKVTVNDYNKEHLKEQIAPRFNQIMTNIGSIDAYFAKAKYSDEDIAEMGSGGLHKKMDEDDASNKVFNAISDWFTDAGGGFISALSSHDPIAGLAAWGHNLMNSVYAALLPTLTTLHAVPYVGKAILPYILFIVPPLFLLGITLAYYLPAVPFIIWVSSVFGWIILVLESLIAAPIWAAMHANPDGEGLAGQRGAQGYLLFIQVLLRPPLMVIGFFFALLLIGTIPLFGEMFSVFFKGLSANETFAGPVTMVAGWFLGGTVIVILVHKAFHLIFWLPEGLMKWMGESGSHMGEKADVGESKQTFVGAVGGYGRAAGERGMGRASQGAGGQGSGDDTEGGSGGGSSEMSGSAKSPEEDHSSGEVGPSEDQTLR